MKTSQRMSREERESTGIGNGVGGKEDRRKDSDSPYWTVPGIGRSVLVERVPNKAHGVVYSPHSAREVWANSTMVDG